MLQTQLLRVRSRLGEWQTFCFDLTAGRPITVWTDGEDQLITASGKQIWLTRMRNTTRLEVAGSTVFTALSAFPIIGSSTFGYPSTNSTPIFGWNVSEWNVDRRYVRQVAKEVVMARPGSAGFYDLPSPFELNFERSVSLCRRLGGQIPDFDSLTSWQATYDSHSGRLPGPKLW